ncbi:MAG: ubiquinone/menaquinone biosynthesis methyltransferase [Anaerolineales bacterium]|nr:MAG: ubiquinone/menaquinone biosynthesis methyltransferase [Anaerolineales bacterium]
MAALEETLPEQDPGFSFAQVASWYDRLNRLMSLGSDRRWRQSAAGQLHLGDGSRVLDVGTGTGDMALALRDRWPSSALVGLDPALEMMQQAGTKRGAGSVGWTLGDGLQLPFPDECFDAVISAFLLRNVGDVAAAIEEQVRVVRAPDLAAGRPGGQVAALELVWPRGRGCGTLFRFYFAKALPALNGLLSGQRQAYRFLPQSVERFQTPDELRITMEMAGLTKVRHHTMSWGTVALHVGERAA